MNRSFIAFARVASIAFALVLSTQGSSFAQVSTSDQMSSPIKIGALTKIIPPSEVVAFGPGLHMLRDDT